MATESTNCELPVDETIEPSLPLDLFPEDQQESEDDLPQVSFQDAMVTNADWTIESICLQIKKGTIDLEPSFQRRDAWDVIRKSRLIESIIVNMPIPNIALAENKDHRGRFIVIDGKQRLTAVDDFFQGRMKLRGLDLRPDLNGKAYGELLAADREAFENSTLRATLIRNWKDENFLWAAFYRLNVGSLPLSPQELRKALIGGKLIDAIEGYLVASTAFHQVFGNALDRRMRDSELVLRFVAFDQSLDAYTGDFKGFLDGVSKRYEGDWDAQLPGLERSLQRLDRALSAADQIFGEFAFRKRIVNRYERVMNRAVFDCVARYFAEEDVARLAVDRRDGVLEAFGEICADPEFKAAIEKTTKTIGATNARLVLWGTKLAAVIGRSFDMTTRRIV